MSTSFLVYVELLILSYSGWKYIVLSLCFNLWLRLLLRLTANIQIDEIHLVTKVQIHFTFDILQPNKIKCLFISSLIVKSLKLLKFFFSRY
jgi:hypothetical protein